MTVTSQYIEATRKVQENWFSAFDALATQFTRQLERPAMTLPEVDARKAVDEIFDFYGKALDVQRETAHKVLAANLEITDQWRNQARQAQDVWREQAKAVTQTAREQAESFAQSAREQAQTLGEKFEEQSAAARDAVQTQVKAASEAAQEQTKRNYNLMNTAQIKAELLARKLDTTGTLDELRARLREADAKA